MRVEASAREMDVGMSWERGDEASVIALEGVVDIASAAELKTILMEALEAGNALRLRIGADAELDVTAIQLLWAAEREAKASGGSLTLEGEAPVTVLAMMRDAGFERFPVSA